MEFKLQQPILDKGGEEMEGKIMEWIDEYFQFVERTLKTICEEYKVEVVKIINSRTDPSAGWAVFDNGMCVSFSWEITLEKGILFKAKASKSPEHHCVVFNKEVNNGTG